MPLSRFINAVLDKTGYSTMLITENTVESKTRLENIKELVSDAVEFEKSEGETRI